MELCPKMHTTPPQGQHPMRTLGAQANTIILKALQVRRARCQKYEDASQSSISESVLFGYSLAPWLDSVQHCLDAILPCDFDLLEPTY